MKRYEDNQLFEIYCDHALRCYAPKADDPNGCHKLDIRLHPNEDPFTTTATYADLKVISRRTNLLVNRIVRIRDEEELDILRSLGVKYETSPNSITRDEMDEGLKHSTKEFAKKITKVTDVNMIRIIADEYAILDKHGLASVNELMKMVIRGRQEELNKNVLTSKINVDMLNFPETVIVEVPVEKIVEVEVEKIVEKIVEVEVEKIVEVPTTIKAESSPSKKKAPAKRTPKKK